MLDVTYSVRDTNFTSYPTDMQGAGRSDFETLEEAMLHASEIANAMGIARDPAREVGDVVFYAEAITQETYRPKLRRLTPPLGLRPRTVPQEPPIQTGTRTRRVIVTRCAEQDARAKA